MEGVEKFLKEQFIPKVVEDKQGIKCLFQHKDKLVEDGVVFFEFVQKEVGVRNLLCLIDSYNCGRRYD